MNKKLYIVFTRLIRGLGGGHIYALNKMKYLEQTGYDTLCLHPNDTRGEFVVKDFEKYKNNYDNHFFFPCYFFKVSTQNSIVNRIIERFIPDPDRYEEIVVETHSTICSTWGELIAKKLNGKHLIYLLDERPPISNKLMYDFFEFKLKRKELVGIGSGSLKNMFEKWRKINDEEAAFLKAHTPEPLADVYYDTSKIPQGDYIIGSITRLEKPFLYPAMTVVKKFAINHPNKKITIIIIGGAVGTNKPQRNIKKLFKGVSNISIVITGIIYPLPLCLVKLPDLFMSVSGSSYSSAKMGIPTIYFDVNDGMPIGIANKKEEITLFRDKKKDVPDIYNIMCDVLENNMFPKPNMEYKTEETIISYKDHLDYLSNEKPREYYWFNTDILSMRFCFISRAIRVIGTSTSKFLVEKLIMPFLN